MSLWGTGAVGGGLVVVELVVVAAFVVVELVVVAAFVVVGLVVVTVLGSGGEAGVVCGLVTEAVGVLVTGGEFGATVLVSAVESEGEWVTVLATATPAIEPGTAAIAKPAASATRCFWTTLAPLSRTPRLP